MSNKTELVQSASFQDVVDKIQHSRDSDVREACISMVQRDMKARETELIEAQNRATELEMIAKQTPEHAAAVAAKQKHERRVAMWTGFAAWSKPACYLLAVTAICLTVFGCFYFQGYWSFHESIGQ